GQGEKPCPYRSTARIELPRFAPDLQEDFLQDVLGFSGISQNTDAEAEKDGCMPVVEPGEGVRVTPSHGRQELRVDEHYGGLRRTWVGWTTEAFRRVLLFSRHADRVRPGFDVVCPD